MTQTAKRLDDMVANLPALKDGLEAGRVRLKEVEAQAQSTLRTLYARGNDELESLLERLPLDALKARVPVDPWVARARTVEAEARDRWEAARQELDRRLADARERMRTWMGAADADELHRVERDVRSLARKVDRIAKASPVAKAPKKQAASSQGSARNGATRTRRKTSS